MPLPSSLSSPHPIAPDRAVDPPRGCQPLTRLGLAAIAVVWVALSGSLAGCMQMSASMTNAAGQSYYRAGQYAVARQEFARAVMDDPQNPHYAYNLARALQAEGNAPAAEHHYRRAVALDPRHQPSYSALGDLLADQGRGQEAMQIVRHWAGSQPFVPEAHLEVAALSQRMGDLHGAETSIRQALQANPQHPTALASLGDLYRETGRTQEAVAAYSQSLRIDPGQAHASQQLAAMTTQARGPQQSRAFIPQTPGQSLAMLGRRPGQHPMMPAAPSPEIRRPITTPLPPATPGFEAMTSDQVQVAWWRPQPAMGPMATRPRQSAVPRPRALPRPIASYPMPPAPPGASHGPSPIALGSPQPFGPPAAQPFASPFPAGELTVDAGPALDAEVLPTQVLPASYVEPSPYGASSYDLPAPPTSGDLIGPALPPTLDATAVDVTEYAAPQSSPTWQPTEWKPAAVPTVTAF